MKKKYFASILISFSFFVNVNGQLTIDNLSTDGRHNPVGIDNQKPKLSWIINSEQRNIKQANFQIRVFESDRKSSSLIWDSKKISSDNTLDISYNGPELKPGQKYYWQVRVWDNKGQSSGWSKMSLWQMGIMNSDNWQAKWIETDRDYNENIPPYFRKAISVDKKIESAILYITSHGLYEAFVNGERVGDSYLTPGWTSYKNRIQYQTYDISDMMTKGDNSVGVVVANGWYKGTLGWIPKENNFGDRLGLYAQIQIKYTDGTEEIIVTDDSWKYSTGEIRLAEIYDGQVIDANKVQNGWNKPGFDDGKWRKALVSSRKSVDIVSTENEHVRRQEVFKPVEFITTPKGETVVDFGQNLVGWESIKLKGNKGDTVRIYHAEVLDKNGNFYTDNLRSAKATSTYVLSGNEDSFEPGLTFYGFRYIKIEGLRESLDSNSVAAVALYSDMPKSGSFQSSNPLINQLQSNIEWGQKGNFLDIPTDCPQRNERLGWTGDAHVFFRTAAFNRGVRPFFKKWMKDMALDQHADGRVPYVIPNILPVQDAASTGWADAAVIIPWQLYMAYGDKEVLSDQYASMKAWVDYMADNSKDCLWNTEKFHFGDWLFFRPDDDKDGIAAITDKYLIAQCFFAHSTDLLAKSAEVLGKDADVKYYNELLGKIKNAFLREYVTPSGRLVSSTQTAYVLALYFDLLPENLRENAVERLVENIRKYNNHLTTGFLGTPYICHVLSRYGRSDVAYELLLQENYPSWLYPVKVGATTIWERWDGRKPDGTFQTEEMNSFNHYSYGAIGDWLYRIAAGIQEVKPAYKEFDVKPHFGGGFSSMKANQMTPYGEVVSAWKIQDSGFSMDVTVPVNTIANVYIPTSDIEKIQERNKHLSACKDIISIDKEDQYVKVRIPSGSYSFSISN